MIKDLIYSVGVDGGTSKTLAMVVDVQGHEQGRSVTDGTNYTVIGLAQAIGHIRCFIEKVTHLAGCQQPLQAAWFGLASVDRSTNVNILLPHLRQLTRAVHLTNDADLTLSALDSGVGVAMIAGTGSIALGCDAHGTISRAGGWGHIIGDKGSGYEIGRLALQATPLLKLILTFCHLNNPSDIIEKVFFDASKAVIAQLSSLAFTAARLGDSVAQKIIEYATSEIALAAVVVVNNGLDFPSEHLPIALVGGLLTNESDFQATVWQHIRHHRSIGRMVVVKYPALGAVHAAIHLTPIDDEDLGSDLLEEER